MRSITDPFDKEGSARNQLIFTISYVRKNSFRSVFEFDTRRIQREYTEIGREKGIRLASRSVRWERSPKRGHVYRERWAWAVAVSPSRIVVCVQVRKGHFGIRNNRCPVQWFLSCLHDSVAGNFHCRALFDASNLDGILGPCVRLSFARFSVR